MTLLKTGAVIAVRLVGLLFAVAAALSIPPTRDMLASDVEVNSDNVLYVPIEICIPSEIVFNGQTVTVPTTDNGGCHTLSFFINACVMSLVLSIVATIMNFCFDFAARCKLGNISLNAVASMSLFLVFILLQTAVCCWAIAKELDFWNSYFDKVHDELGDSFLTDIQTRGSRNRLVVTGTLSVLFAALLLVEAFFNFCCAKRQEATVTPESSSFRKSGVASPTSTATMDLEASNSLDQTEKSNTSGNNNNINGEEEGSVAFGTTSELPPWANTN
ncbi:hypothetical protein ACA910_001476 [Epithemia clementina (nom. ined.)]